MIKKNDKTKYNLSVIVPAYNVTDYIGRCLDSLEAQDGISIEIVIVNDGSTDTTLDVINNYASRYTNIRVINQENKGLYHARTNGIKYVTSEYVTFCDADDYIDKDFYQIVLGKMIKADADVLQYGVRKIQYGKDLWKFAPKEASCDGIEAVKHIFEKINCTCSNCNKIYKISLFDGVLFNEDIRRYEEDKLINIKIVGKAMRVVSIPDIGYNYDTREGSITTTQSGLDYLDMLKTNEIIFEYVKANVPQALQPAAYDYCAHLAYCYSYCYRNQGDDIAEKEILPKFKKVYKEEGLRSYKPANASLKRKLMMNILRFSPKLCVLLYKVVA